MASKKVDFGDTVAQSMESIMNDDSYQRIFAKPAIKVASVPAVEPKKDVQGALATLLATSDMLDSMGLEKSAASVLNAANDLVKEMSKEAQDLMEVMPADDDGELEALLNSLNDDTVEVSEHGLNYDDPGSMKIQKGDRAPYRSGGRDWVNAKSLAPDERLELEFGAGLFERDDSVDVDQIVMEDEEEDYGYDDEDLAAHKAMEKEDDDNDNY